MTTLLASLLGSMAVAGGDAGGGVWLPPKASTIAASIDWIFWFIFWICVFFFVLIVGLLVLFIVKYRRREHVADTGGPTHNTPLELTWTIIPLILVIAIFYMGLDGYMDLVQAPKNAYEVQVTGRQWSWDFEHRNGAVDNTVLKVPVDTPVKLVMTSEDVIHAVYIPAFRVKQDVVPGRYTYLWFEAKDPGRYQLLCAEYCGTAHSQMVAFVEVLPKDEFEVQIQQDANWFKDVPDEMLHVAGHRLFAPCASCHSLKKGEVKIGPPYWETHDLFKSGEPRVLADGSQATVDENYLRNSILNPGGQVVMNYPNQMPSFAGQLSERKIRALIELIKRLDEVVDEQGNLLE